MRKNLKNYHHGDLRNSLLKAALEILEREGAENLSLRAAAKKAAVSSAAPYRHFPSKEALLVALAEDGFAGMEKGMQAAARKNPNNPQAQLMDLGKTYLRLAAERPHFFRMMFSVELKPMPGDEGAAMACVRVYDSLINLFRQGQKLGQFKASPAEGQGLLYWSALHGYAMLLIDGKLDEMEMKMEQHLAQLAELLKIMFQGLEK
ncbi:MAG TPA: TetR family transcriptional regulator [bacterium]|jgi:AcrR family transcriptional regulator|nr:TetR family transcriptional regulator [bacterium]